MLPYNLQLESVHILDTGAAPMPDGPMLNVRGVARFSSPLRGVHVDVSFEDAAAYMVEHIVGERITRAPVVSTVATAGALAWAREYQLGSLAAYGGPTREEYDAWQSEAAREAMRP